MDKPRKYTPEEREQKWQQFEAFLAELESQYPELGTSKIHPNPKWYAMYGTGLPPDIKLGFHPDVREELRVLIESKLREIFPRVPD